MDRPSTSSQINYAARREVRTRRSGVARVRQTEEMQQYRIADRTFGRLLALMSFGALSILVAVGTDDTLPGPIRIGILVAGLGGVAALVAWARVACTGTDPEGVTVRGLLRTRTFAWPDIQAIQIEQNPGGYIDDRGPKQIAVLYDKTGRRVPMPHVNDKNLETFAVEVETMRADWEHWRGPDWVPIASVQRTADQRVRYRFTSWATGAFAAMLAVPVAAVIFVVGLFTRASELPSPLSWPFQPISIMVLPAIVFPIVAVASMVARQRATPR